MENMTTLETIKLFAPLIVIQVFLAAFCVFDILKKGVRNFNKGVWIAIVMVLNLIGPISYLTMGRKRWGDD